MLGRLKTLLIRKLYKSIYRPGHYYSPIPALEEFEDDWTKYSQENSDTIDDIELNVNEQLSLLDSFIQYQNDIDFTGEKTNGNRYFSNNSFFVNGDAMASYSIIRHFKPRRIIEVGSGFSSCIYLDVNERFFQNSIKLTFIEPYPDRLLSLLNEHDTEHVSIIQRKVQDVDISIFRELDYSDILFIDSSHVSKFGSDLNHLVFNVLPALNSGVIIHFHDICYPFEYPVEWLKKGIFWNETYILRALLMNNPAYTIMLWCNYISKFHREFLTANLPKFHTMGGSFWIRKI